MKSYFNSFSSKIQCSGEIFYKEHQKFIKELLNDCTVATDESNSDQIFGWACIKDGCIHYIYVKGPFRKFGISKALLGHADLRTIISHSHDNSQFKTLNLATEYNPYLFYKGN